ncbi:hypothetical protein ACW7N6_38465 [Streptomyces sp. UC1A3]
MAWTAPMTAVAGATFTAAQFNAHVRDNLNETAPAKATAGAQFFVSTGANAIAARQMASASVNTPQNTSSTAYGDLATPGPSVTVTTGSLALVMFSSGIDNTVTNGASEASVQVSGASSVAASVDWCLRRDGVNASNTFRYGTAHMFSGLVPGQNTFTMKYKVGSGIGNFFSREIIVLPF